MRERERDIYTYTQMWQFSKDHTAQKWKHSQLDNMLKITELRSESTECLYILPKITELRSGST